MWFTLPLHHPNEPNPPPFSREGRALLGNSPGPSRRVPLYHPGEISPSKDQLGKRHHPDLSPAWVLPGFIWASFVP